MKANFSEESLRGQEDEFVRSWLLDCSSRKRKAVLEVSRSALATVTKAENIAQTEEWTEDILQRRGFVTDRDCCRAVVCVGRNRRKLTNVLTAVAFGFLQNLLLGYVNEFLRFSFHSRLSMRTGGRKKNTPHKKREKEGNSLLWGYTFQFEFIMHADYWQCRKIDIERVRCRAGAFSIFTSPAAKWSGCISCG